MGFLQGSSDVSSFRSDLYNMLTGAQAAGQRGSGQAGNGVTLSAGDRWVGLDPINFVVRSPSTDAPFAAEYALYRGAPRFAARATGTILAATPQAQIGKPTFSGAYSGVTVRAYFAAFVSTINAAPGSLASTVVTWTLVNADSGATVTSGTASGWTGSSDTKLLTQGVSLTLTLGGSDSFVAGTNAVMWLRAYTTTLTDGIDYFPEAAKISGTIVVANSAGGANAYTLNTDYNLVQQVHVFPQVSATIGYFSAALDWGGNGAGCGIHWLTSGAPPAAGANYFVPTSYSIYNGYLQVFNVANVGGNYSLVGAPMEVWDATLAAGRFVLTTAASPKTTLNTTVSYAQLFTGAAQPGSTFINFWISCTATKIVMVFRGDPGQSGRLVVLTLQKYSTLVSADKWPWIFVADGSVTASSGGAILVSSKYVYEQPYWGSPAVSMGVINLPFYYGPQPIGSAFQLKLAGISIDASPTASAGAAMPRQNPNNWDLRHWLYAIYVAANLGGSNISGTFDSAKAQALRGKLQGIFGVANDNFSSLDTLVDGSSTYLLIIPTSSPFSSQGQNYNALAMLE